MKRLLTLFAALLVASAAHAEIGDDGLYKEPWFRDTFKDMSEDLSEAGAEGKRFMVIIEQRGCIYCKKMHEEVFSDPVVKQLIEDNYFVVQLNMFGDIEVTDFDGESMAEKDMVKRWNALFTPTILFFPESVEEGQTGAQAAVVTMPGAFGKWTTVNLLNWVLEKGYDGDEPFQKYHARKFSEQAG
ncbi:thioredoxin family protein [Vannielia litorea]|uniref:thioredoxin family protein n=1 Tax=Vannielia litorea TaxID=1217970 RepID=UPI001BCF1FCC|nr:thioredoxin family protein [Vannielia litorea]MBS8227094.1 thioredoxin [Vannielia litorea]